MSLIRRLIGLLALAVTTATDLILAVALCGLAYLLGGLRWMALPSDLADDPADGPAVPAWMRPTTHRGDAGRWEERPTGMDVADYGWDED
jgi:hypothetical protein